MIEDDPTRLSEDRIDAIERFLGNWLTEEGLPGVSVALTTDEDLVYAGGVGSRDLATNAPATADTVYGMGSVTKSVTALSILQLIERDELRVEDPITAHLDVDLGNADPTIHELLTHSSGIPSLGTSSVLIARQAGIGESRLPLGDRDDFYHHLSSAADEVGPAGERFMYCNEAYGLLAHIVETVDDRDFPTYLDEEVFEPLEMDRSTLRADEFEAFDDAMTPYWFEEDEPKPTELPVRELSYGPGGLLSSVTDLTAYLRMQLNGGSYEGTELVDSELLTRAHEGHVETPGGPYGYGWRTRTSLGRTIIGHSGSIAVSTAFAGFLPTERLGVAVACNAAPGYPLAHLGAGIVAVALGDDPEEIPFFARRRRIDHVTGEYEAYRGVQTATVEERGGLLELTFSNAFGEESMALVPEEPTLGGYQFYAPTAGGGRQPVEFIVDEDGVDLFVERWRLHRVSGEAHR